MTVIFFGTPPSVQTCIQSSWPRRFSSIIFLQHLGTTPPFWSISVGPILRYRRFRLPRNVSPRRLRACSEVLQSDLNLVGEEQTTLSDVFFDLTGTAALGLGRFASSRTASGSSLSSGVSALSILSQS
jgi:hypothetical protein